MKKGKILAVDYGSKRVGLASGDFEMKIAFPRDVIENKSFEYLSGKILDFVREWGIKTIVFGLPLNMKDEHVRNNIFDKLEAFLERFKALLLNSDDEFISSVKIELFDERLSSFEADELMATALDEFKDKTLHRDAIAAQIILQRYFEVVEW